MALICLKILLICALQATCVVDEQRSFMVKEPYAGDSDFLRKQGFMSTSFSSAKPFSIEQVVGVRYWTPSLLSFTTTRPLELNYLPGQYTRIGLTVGHRVVWRAFSFVSAPNERLLEFVAALVPDGLFTSRLGAIQPNDEIHIEHENYGFMTTDRFVDGDDLWMLATGTGIGPFVSMLRDDAVWKQFRHIVLVHGVRGPAELIYRDELQGMQPRSGKERAQILLACCISRHNGMAANDCLPGRITSTWDNGTLELATGLTITPTASRVMLCGNPQMIEEMRARMHARGLVPCRRMTAGQFLTENYW